MANETQFRATTQIIATRGVTEYRETIPAVVGPDDHVREVGCAWGTTTAVLAQYAAHVIGTDISPKCIGRARAMRPGLDFRVLDAFDIRSVLDLGLPISKVYMDLSGLSGYRGLLDLIALIQSYAGIVSRYSVTPRVAMICVVARNCVSFAISPSPQRRGQTAPADEKAPVSHHQAPLTGEPGHGRRRS